MEVNMMTMILAKIKAYYNIALQKAYMPILQDKNKERYSKIYAFADKQWRKHAFKTLDALKLIINIKKESL